MVGGPHPHTHFKDKVSDRILFCARIGSNDESKGEGPFYSIITSPTQKRTDENGWEGPEFCPDGAMVGVPHPHTHFKDKVSDGIF